MSASTQTDSLITRAGGVVSRSARPAPSLKMTENRAGGLKIFAFLQGDDILAFRPCDSGPQSLNMRLLTGAPTVLQAHAELCGVDGAALSTTSFEITAQEPLEPRPEETFFADHRQRSPYNAVGEFDIPDGCAQVILRLTPSKNRTPVLVLDAASLAAKTTGAAAAPARVLLRAAGGAPARVMAFAQEPLQAGRGYGVLLAPPLMGSGSGAARLRRYMADGAEIPPDPFETTDETGASTFSLPCLRGEASHEPYPKAFGLSQAPYALEVAVTTNMVDAVAVLDATQLGVRQTDSLEEVAWFADESLSLEDRLDPRHPANRGVGAMDVLYQRVLDVAQDLRGPQGGAADFVAAAAAGRDTGGARTVVSAAWPGADYFRGARDKNSEAEIASVAGHGKCLKFHVSQFFSPWQMRNSFGKEVSATFIVNGSASFPVKWVNDKSTVLLPLNAIDSSIQPGDVIDFFSPGTGKILFTFTFPEEADEVVEVADLYFQYPTRGALFFRARRADEQRKAFTASMVLSINGKSRTEAVEFSRLRDEDVLLQARAPLPKSAEGSQRVIRLAGVRLADPETPVRRMPDLACLGTDCVMTVGDIDRTPDGGLEMTTILYRERKLVDYRAVLIAHGAETPLERGADREEYRFAGGGLHRLTIPPEALNDPEAAVKAQQVGGSGFATIPLAKALKIVDER